MWLKSPIARMIASRNQTNASATMNNDSPLPFELRALARKKVTVAFDGGRLTSDGGVFLLAQIEQRLDIAERLARCIEDPRDPACVDHTLARDDPVPCAADCGRLSRWQRL
jgi:hypothetical protein